MMRKKDYTFDVWIKLKVQEGAIANNEDEAFDLVIESLEYDYGEFEVISSELVSAEPLTLADRKERSE